MPRAHSPPGLAQPGPDGLMFLGAGRQSRRGGSDTAGLLGATLIGTRGTKDRLLYLPEKGPASPCETLAPSDASIGPLLAPDLSFFRPTPCRLTPPWPQGPAGPPGPQGGQVPPSGLRANLHFSHSLLCARQSVVARRARKVVQGFSPKDPPRAKALHYFPPPPLRPCQSVRNAG